MAVLSPQLLVEHGLRRHHELLILVLLSGLLSGCEQLEWAYCRHFDARSATPFCCEQDRGIWDGTRCHPHEG